MRKCEAPKKRKKATKPTLRDQFPGKSASIEEIESGSCYDESEGAERDASLRGFQEPKVRPYPYNISGIDEASLNDLAYDLDQVDNNLKRSNDEKTNGSRHRYTKVGV